MNLKMGVDLWGEVEYTSESFIQVLSQEPLKMLDIARMTFLEFLAQKLSFNNLDNERNLIDGEEIEVNINF